MELAKGDKLELTKNDGAIITTKDPSFDNSNTLNTPLDLDKTFANLVKSGRTVKVIIGKPWAIDAKSRELKTWYTIENSNTLRQHINLKNAVFPVVADPIWCGNQIHTTFWVKNREGWTLSTIPTYCGRFLASRYIVNDSGDAWNEVLSKTKTYSYIGYNYYNTWDKKYGTAVYWSMYNQFICHYANPAAQIVKGDWNLDMWRPNVGLSQTYSKQCNP